MSGEDPLRSHAARPAQPSRGRSSFQALVAFSVIPPAFRNPVQAAVGVRRLVGIVLIQARVYARLPADSLEYLGLTAVGNTALPLVEGTAFEAEGGAGRVAVVEAGARLGAVVVGDVVRAAGPAARAAVPGAAARVPLRQEVMKVLRSSPFSFCVLA